MSQPAQARGLPTSASDALARGWHAVNIPPGSPNCNRKGWQTTASPLEDWGPEDGVGIVLGPSGLVDLDLDCPEAMIVAPILLPRTATFGREGKARTHWVYECSAEKPAKWEDPDAHGRSVVLELRTGPQYSLFPPSKHFKDGLPVAWDLGPEEISAASQPLLIRACRAVAIAVIAARAIPDGGRHDGALALAGCLALGGWSEEEAVLVLSAMARLWRFDDGNVQEGVTSTYARAAKGEPIASWRGLSDRGVSQARLNALRGAVGVREGTVVVDLSEDVGAAVDKVLRAWRQSEADLFDGGEGKVVRAIGGTLREIDMAGASEEIGRRVTFVRNGKPAAKIPAEVPTVLCARGVWPELRSLKGLSRVPIIHTDGSVHEVPGYDERSGLWFSGESVPSSTSRVDALVGLKALLECTRESWWEDPIDQLGWVAHVLTHLARPVINGPVPIWVYSANAAGSGKTTLAQRAAWVTTGSLPGATSIGFGSDEWSKTLFAAAGMEALLLDNIRGRIESVELEAAVLSGSVSARKFHTQDTISRVWRPVVAVTANGATLGADIARRVLPVRLCRPLKTLAYTSDLTLDRRSLLSAGLTIIRAYLASGVKTEVMLWQSYSAWSQVVAAALRWLGMPDLVQETRPFVDSLDTETEDRYRIAGLLRDYLAASKWIERGCTAAEICMDGIGNTGPGDAVTRRALYDALRETIEQRKGSGIAPRQVGNFLRGMGGGVISRTIGGVRHWRVAESGRA